MARGGLLGGLGAMGGTASPTTWQGDGTPQGMPKLPNGQSYQHGSQLGPAQTPPWWNASMGALPTPPAQQWGANGQVTYQGGVPAIKAYNHALSDMRHAATRGQGRQFSEAGMMDSGWQGNAGALWSSMSPEQQAYWQAQAPNIDPNKQYHGTQKGGVGGGPGTSGIQQLIAAQPWNQPAAPTPGPAAPAPTTGNDPTGQVAQALAQLYGQYGA